MDRNVTWVVLAYAAVMGACGAAYEPGDGATGTGIYALTIEGDSDACAPTRATGFMGKVAVVAQHAELAMMVPDTLGAVGATSRVVLPETAGGHVATEVAVPGCEATTLRREWTMLGAGSDAVELAYSESWTGVGACTSAAAPSLPRADCRADQRLRYDRRTLCEAPCQIVWAPTTGALTCDCR